MRFLRLRGVIALAVFTVLGCVWWLAFGERTVKTTLEEAATTSLGTQVDISRLGINLRNATLELSGVAIADPFDSTRNLLDARSAVLELEIEPLLQKKIVVRHFALDGVESGTKRATPARPVDTTGFVPRALREIHRFREQLSVPLLSLTPIDTIKSLILDPTQLRTVQAAIAVEQRADSVKTAVTQKGEAILQSDLLDSARALTDRLRGQTLRTLGVTGTLRAVNDVRRMSTRVDSLRRAVDDLQRGTRNGFDSITAALRTLDDSRRADYEFARGLIALPTFDAPSIGPSLFGEVSISAFEKGLYLVSVAREHAPPGLLPRERPGPKRMRLPGTTVHFVTAKSFPRFLLRDGDVSMSLGGTTGAARGDYVLSATNITTEPALIAEPMRFSLKRSAAASDVRTIEVTGTLDHRGPRTSDIVNLRAGGVKLPSFALPGTPLSVDLGRGNSAMSLTVVGDSIAARWSIESAQPVWSTDSSRTNTLNTLERLVTSVISGIRTVSVEAELTGTMASPKLSVRSNLDREVAASIRNVVGVEIEKAEQRVRAQVDSIVEVRLAPARARVAELRAAADEKVKEVTARVDELKAQLTAQLRALGG